VYQGVVEIPTNTAANDIWLDIAGMMIAMLFFTIVWNATVGEGTVDGFGGMVVGAFSWLMIEATDVTMNAAPHFARSILTTSLDFSTFWMFWLATALGSLMAFWMWDEIMGEGEDNSEE
jgi:glycerol uptake facilitator-like aquaporin